jgi:hypothetical protein
MMNIVCVGRIPSDIFKPHFRELQCHSIWYRSSGTAKKELPMKRYQWTLAMLLVVVAQCAFADTISTFDITGVAISVVQFGGDNNNLRLVFTGPGTDISASGVILCQSWCGVEKIFPAGSKSPVPFGPEDIYLEGLSTVRVGGQSFFPDATGLEGPLALSFSGGFTFPVKGSSFTACQPASISSPITGSGSATSGQFIDFALLMPAGGKFCSTWDFSPAFPGSPAGYQFVKGNFVAGVTPEPGTLGLMASGLAGLVGVILRKRNWRVRN